jgi:hypothetical protein
LSIFALLLVLCLGNGQGMFAGISSASAKDGGESGGSDSGSSSGSGGRDHGEDGSGSGSGRDDNATHANGGRDDRGGRDDGGASGRDRIEIVYTDGYRERIEGGILRLTDPRGHTVVRRRATAEDEIRLQSLTK